MSEQTSYRCDICKVEKQQSNHWLKGYLLSDGALTGVIVVPWTSGDLGLTEQGARVKLNKPDAHLCGEAHANRVGKQESIQEVKSEP